MSDNFSTLCITKVLKCLIKLYIFNFITFSFFPKRWNSGWEASKRQRAMWTLPLVLMGRESSGVIGPSQSLGQANSGRAQVWAVVDRPGGRKGRSGSHELNKHKCWSSEGNLFRGVAGGRAPGYSQTVWPRGRTLSCRRVERNAASKLKPSLTNVEGDGEWRSSSVQLSSGLSTWDLALSLLAKTQTQSSHFLGK